MALAQLKPNILVKLAVLIEVLNYSSKFLNYRNVFRWDFNERNKEACIK